MADIRAIEQMPYHRRGFPTTTYDILRRSAMLYPQRLALRFLATAELDEVAACWTYAELFQDIQRTANLFTSLSVQRDGVISCVLPNLPQMTITLFGGSAAGIVNPINPLLEGAVIAAIVREAGASVLVLSGPSMGDGIWQKLLPHFALLPKLKAILQVNPASDGLIDEENSPLYYEGDLPVYDFDMAIAAQLPDVLLATPPLQHHIAAYFHTGGTTGIPKLAMHTHANQAFLTASASLVLENGMEDVALGGLPLFHVNALFSAGLLVFAGGGSVLIATPSGFRNPRVIQNFWQLVERYRVTWFSAVPTVFAALLSVPRENTTHATLRYAICGAAPMPHGTFAAFEKHSGLRLIEGYGLTEGTCMSALNPLHGERRIGSIGLRIPYQEMKVVRLDAQGDYAGDCAVDEAGAVVIRGPNLFAGYCHANDEADLMHDGWFNTGDLGRCDADGYFWLVGRAKDLIIRGGHNIDPHPIEQAFERHHAVLLAAAVGQPDAYAGELPCVYVTVKPGQEVTAEALHAFGLAHCGERAAAPVHVEILPQMPLTAVGKIFKPALRCMAAERVLMQALAAANLAAQVSASVSPQHGMTLMVRSSAAISALQTVTEKFAFKTEFS